MEGRLCPNTYEGWFERLILNFKKNSVLTLTLCSNIFIYQTNYRRRLVVFKTRVPGYDPIMQRQIRPMTGLERSLYKLNAVRELGDWADEFIDLETEEDDGNDGNGSFYTSNSSSNSGNKTILNNDDLLQEEEESSIDIDGSTSTDSNIAVPPTMVAQPCVVGDDSSFPSPVIRNRQDSVIVIIR